MVGMMKHRKNDDSGRLTVLVVTVACFLLHGCGTPTATSHSAEDLDRDSDVAVSLREEARAAEPIFNGSVNGYDVAVVPVSDRPQGKLVCTEEQRSRGEARSNGAILKAVEQAKTEGRDYSVVEPVVGVPEKEQALTRDYGLVLIALCGGSRAYAELWPKDPSVTPLWAAVDRSEQVGWIDAETSRQLDAVRADFQAPGVPTPRATGDVSG